MSKSRVLQLAVNGEYFDQMKSGEKKEEYRLYNAYWQRRIEGREYDQLIITRGYPKRDDAEKRLVMSYAGYEVKTITHPHFGPDPVKVFAIKVNVNEVCVTEPDNAYLHHQLVKLGDMIGEGLADEPGGAWIRRDYRKIMHSLGLHVPRRQNTKMPENVKNSIDKNMVLRCDREKCPECKRHSLKQTRSGSMTARCTLCGRRYKLLRCGKNK